MKLPPMRRRLLVVLAILLPLAGFFAYAALRTGPFAPLPVRVAAIERKPLAPGLFGIGTVEARWRYRIGPTRTGRLAELAVDVGDAVKAGQILGRMDPIDLDDRLAAQAASVAAMESAVAMAEARLNDTKTHRDFTASQHRRYAALLGSRAVSADTAEGAAQRDQAAAAAVVSAIAAVELARRELAAGRANLNALARQKDELTLRAPVAGLIVERRIEPGSTAMAGEAVVEMIDPATLWIHLRVNQLDAAGLRAGLTCRIELRSRPGKILPGRVLRIEPLADEVTEEMLAKVVFDRTPDPLPPLGELTEVRIELPAGPATTVVPAAAIQTHRDRRGVWLVAGDTPRFQPVRTGRRSDDGEIEVLSGLATVARDARVIVHSERPLSPRNRLEILPDSP